MTQLPFEIEERIDTPLGLVRCGFKCDSSIKFQETKGYENGHSKIYATVGHRIEFVTFKIRQPLPNGDTVSGNCGWLFRIEKTSTITEKIETFCFLDNYPENTEFDTATGESLDAISATYNDWILHIGTEDGEVLNSRARENDWFPERLLNLVDFYQTISAMKKNGFVTSIPQLEIGEQIHIHFLAAFDKKEENRINTWAAVDESKRHLENWVGLW